MKQNQIVPPWEWMPDHDTTSNFWRLDGADWARSTWTPFIESLSAKERSKYLQENKAPKDWRDFYSSSYMKGIKQADGIGGFILRNNLCYNGHGDLDNFTSAQTVTKSNNRTQWLLISLAIVVGLALALIKDWR